MLAVGSVLFWILIGIVGVLLFVAVEYERAGWATISVVATLALLAWLGNFSLRAIIKGNPLMAFAFLAAYIIIGFVWSFGKWYFYVRNMRAQYDEAKKEGLRIISYYNKPDINKNKARALTWAIYWPWSMVWTLINDPIKNLFKYFFRRLQAVYQKIADKAYGEVELPEDDGTQHFPPLKKGEEILPPEEK